MISGYDRSNNVVFISRLISSAHLQRNWLTRSVPNNRVTMDSLLVSGSGAARGSLVVSEIGDRGMVWEDSRLKYQEVCFQCIKIHHKTHRAYESILCLTHCGLVTPYGHIDLVQNWLMAPSHYLNQCLALLSFLASMCHGNAGSTTSTVRCEWVPWHFHI